MLWGNRESQGKGRCKGGRDRGEWLENALDSSNGGIFLHDKIVIKSTPARHRRGFTMTFPGKVQTLSPLCIHLFFFGVHHADQDPSRPD
ncbi:hypothetical protein [Herbaspirillum sp. GW103]|uniref:hypothetical protein n=1 Tax=Herbaspirillum sp. GW103 TaxID=1175306 RepID=UPI00178C79AA|nr:hypothetical protein [Herbaspirillum sp. GW103]